MLDSTPARPDRSLATLFEAGRLGDRDDGWLLDRFRHGDDVIGPEAFRVLVQRYGPIVMAVCRGMLSDDQLAEDAFQATFLVLIRKASSIRRRQSVGPWLHGVALRVAQRARSQARRRGVLEQPLAGDVPAERANQGLDAEIIEALHAEIDRLPRRLREPLVLCCLEERSYQQAAGLLGVSESTLRGRLHRGRKRLESRLRAQGFSLECCLPPGASARPLLQQLAPSIVRATVQLGVKWQTLGSLAGQTGSSSVLLLAQGVITSMIWNSIKLAAIPALMAACVAGSVVLGQQGNAPGTQRLGPSSAATKASAKKGAPDVAAKRVRLTGHIRELLTRKYDLGLPKDPSLEQFLKSIRQVTVESDKSSAEDFHGIPIYLDPDGLRYVGMTPESRLAVDPGERTLATTLQDSLKAVKLWYEVEDGFLRIDSRVGIVASRLQRVEDKVDRLIKAIEAREKLR